MIENKTNFIIWKYMFKRMFEKTLRAYVFSNLTHTQFLKVRLYIHTDTIKKKIYNPGNNSLGWLCGNIRMFYYLHIIYSVRRKCLCYTYKNIWNNVSHLYMWHFAKNIHTLNFIIFYTQHVCVARLKLYVFLRFAQ